jgi:hypothetical protein
MFGQFQPLTSVEEYERSGGEILRLNTVSTLPLFPDVPLEYADWTLLQTNLPALFPSAAANPNLPLPADAAPLTAPIVPSQRGGGWAMVPVAIIGTLVFLEVYRRWIEPRKRHA